MCGWGSRHAAYSKLQKLRLFKASSSSALLIFFNLLFIIWCSSFTIIASELKVTNNALPEIVFSWEKQRCHRLNYPDSPARAYRKNDGTLIVTIAHYINGVLKGSNFHSLFPDCSVAFKGDERPNPEEFNDLYWLQALVRIPGRQVYGLFSHEYHGARHKGMCAAQGERGEKCWYSAIVAGVADEDVLNFHLLPPSKRLVVAPIRKYDINSERRSGFFTTSNVIDGDDGHYYFYSFTTDAGNDGNKSGNCLLRGTMSAGEIAWEKFHDGNFVPAGKSPYDLFSEPTFCTPISNIYGPLRSVIKIGDLWYSVFTGPKGVLYSTSGNLVEWSTPRTLLPVTIVKSKTSCETVYEYPSLIDHSSSSDIFDRGLSDIFLYITRFNWGDCKRGPNRDLVRFKIEAENTH